MRANIPLANSEGLQRLRVWLEKRQIDHWLLNQVERELKRRIFVLLGTRK